MTQTIYIFQGDYKKQFEDYTKDIVNNRIEDRQQRKETIDALIEEYVKQTGERPEGRQLEKLANAIMFEELEGDTRADKMTLEAEPVMTQSQTNRRHGNEAGGDALTLIGSDSRSYRRPVRRPLTTGEMISVDQASGTKTQEASEVVSSK